MSFFVTSTYSIDPTRRGSGATKSTRLARAAWLFPQTRELLPASHVSLASATLQQIVTVLTEVRRGDLSIVMQKFRSNVAAAARSTLDACMHATRRTRRRTWTRTDSQVLVRLICALNHSAMEITWRRSRLADGRTDGHGRTRTERRGDADAVHDSALVSAVVAVADGRSSSIPDGGLKSETAPEPKSCQTG